MVKRNAPKINFHHGVPRHMCWVSACPGQLPAEKPCHHVSLTMVFFVQKMETNCIQKHTLGWEKRQNPHPWLPLNGSWRLYLRYVRFIRVFFPRLQHCSNTLQPSCAQLTSQGLRAAIGLAQRVDLGTWSSDERFESSYMTQVTTGWWLTKTFETSEGSNLKIIPKRSKKDGKWNMFKSNFLPTSQRYDKILHVWALSLA